MSAAPSPWIVGFGCGGAVLLAIAAYAAQSDRFRPAPSLADMRAYRISIATDDQIRQWQEEARVESAKQSALFHVGKAQAREEDGARLGRCQETVYRLRHGTECAGPLLPFSNYQEVYVQTPEALFEERLVGSCSFARTREDARRRRCMPPE